MPIRFSTFPRTQKPPDFLNSVIEVFRGYAGRIETAEGRKGLTSGAVLEIVRPGLVDLGFEVESGKGGSQKIRRIRLARSRC